MLSKIREDLNALEQQANVTLPSGPSDHRTLPQTDKGKSNSKKMTKARLGLMPQISGF